MSLFVLPRQTSFDADGQPRVAAEIYIYEAGTDNLAELFTTAAYAVEQANPVVSVEGGIFPAFYINPSVYPTIKVVVLDADGLTITTDDDVPVPLNTAADILAILTPAVVGQILYPRTQNEIDAGVTPSNYLYPEFNLLRYGADPTGVASSTSAVTQVNAVVAASDYGCKIVVPPGTYLFATQATWTPRDEYRVMVEGYGAVFKSSGAISTTKIAGGTTTGGFTFRGISWDAHDDAGVTYSVDNEGTSHTHFEECWFRYGDNGSSFSSVMLRNSTPADAETGSYWPSFRDCIFRKLSGADGADITQIITLQGNPNAARFTGNVFTHAVNGILAKTESGQTFGSNGVLVDGNAFEAVKYPITLNGAAATEFGGWRVVNNRHEPTVVYPTNALVKLTGSTTQAAVPLQLGFNYGTPDALYIDNANSIYYYSLDSWSSGSVAPHLDVFAPLVAKNRSGNGGILDLQTGLNGAAAIVGRDQAGTATITIKLNASNIVQVIPNATDAIEFYGVKLVGFDLSATGLIITRRAGTPESNITATVGSLSLNSAGGVDTTAYTKTSGAGNTGWTAVDNV